MLRLLVVILTFTFGFTVSLLAGQQVRNIGHLLDDPREIINSSPGIQVRFVSLRLDPPRKAHHGNVYASCTSFFQSLPGFSLWSLSNEVKWTIQLLEWSPRGLHRSPPLRETRAVSSWVDEGNDILLLALYPFWDLPRSIFHREVLVVIGRHQNIFGDELQGTYTICWPTCFLKDDEARHEVLPSSIRRNSAQITYHPFEICWKICVVSDNHICIAIASILGGGLSEFRGLVNRSSAGNRITNHLYLVPWCINTQDLPESYHQSTPGIPHQPKKGVLPLCRGWLGLVIWSFE